MSSNTNKIIISVVVCTYNRSQLLRKCLESLVNQNFSNAQFEVMVVDNCSSDDTDTVIQEFIVGYKNVRGLKEDRPGLSNARNLGWKVAFGEYVAYIDDDAIAPPDWISNINAFIERQSSVLAFGGPYESYSLIQVPSWFPAEYGSWTLGEEERPINLGADWINGTNMIFKKEVLSEFGGFSSDLGMIGDSVSYGEETSFLLELKKNNLPVYYVPNIKVFHLIANHKMKLSWLLFSSYKIGRCSVSTLGVRRTLISHLSAITACLLIGVVNMLSIYAEPFKRRLYMSFSSLFIELGALVEYVSTIKR